MGIPGFSHQNGREPHSYLCRERKDSSHRHFFFKERMAVNVVCLNLLAFQRALRKNVLQRPSFFAHFPFKIGQ